MAVTSISRRNNGISRQTRRICRAGQHIPPVGQAAAYIRGMHGVEPAPFSAPRLASPT